MCDLAKQLLSLAFTMASFERTGMPYAHQASKKVSLCISRIARKWQFSPPTPGWMRRKAFSSDSFDVLTLWQSVPTLESSHHLIRQTHRSKRKVYEAALSPSNVLFRHKKDTWHRTAKPILIPLPRATRLFCNKPWQFFEAEQINITFVANNPVNTKFYY